MLQHLEHAGVGESKGLHLLWCGHAVGCPAASVVDGVGEFLVLVLAVVVEESHPLGDLEFVEVLFSEAEFVDELGVVAVFAGGVFHLGDGSHGAVRYPVVFALSSSHPDVHGALPVVAAFALQDDVFFGDVPAGDRVLDVDVVLDVFWDLGGFFGLGVV